MFFRLCRPKKFAKQRFTERREFLRLDADIPVQYFIIPKDKEENLKLLHCHESETRNVSGGGLLLEIPVLSDEILLTTHLIKIQFTLPKNPEPIETIARMVSVEKPEHIEGFYLRVCFVKIKKEDQEKLINYIERKHRKK